MPKFVSLLAELVAEQFLGASNWDKVPGVELDTPLLAGGDPRYYVTTVHNQKVYLEPGDWVAAEPNAPGKYYPIKPDVFAKRWTPAPAADKLMQYHFDCGDSTKGAIGLSARVIASSQAQAVTYLREALDFEEVKVQHNGGKEVVYVSVYLNANNISVADIDDEAEYTA